jgi:hypothetical protein
MVRCAADPRAAGFAGDRGSPSDVLSPVSLLKLTLRRHRAGASSRTLIATAPGTGTRQRPSTPPLRKVASLLLRWYCRCSCRLYAVTPRPRPDAYERFGSQNAKGECAKAHTRAPARLLWPNGSGVVRRDAATGGTVSDAAKKTAKPTSEYSSDLAGGPGSAVHRAARD